MRARWLRLLVGSLALAATAGTACSRGSAPPGRSTDLRVGDTAPGFSLPSTGGGSVSLAQFRGHKPVLLYFSMGPG